MKNDIDSILESMFRGGRLHFKSSGQPAETEKPQSASPAQALSQAEAHAQETQRALDAVEDAGDGLSQSLRQSIERLTQEAKADMADLERHLRQDGIDTQQVSRNAGDPVDLEMAFQVARQEAGALVLGQEEFLDSLLIAFKRPFVAGAREEKPLCRAVVSGPHGTGRHSALRCVTASLGRQGVLKSPKTALLDLSRYSAAGSEKLFVQDFYAAVKSGASTLVLEHWERCHTGVLSMVASLFRQGEIPLPSRYAEQKGMLVEIGTALVPGAVSTLSAGGKYLFLLTEQPASKLVDAFGAPFLAALDDQCQTQPFTRASLEEIARRELEDLVDRCQRKLQMKLSFGESEVQALADSFTPGQGAYAIKEGADRMYRALSEEKLRKNLGRVEGRLLGEGGALRAEYTQAGLVTQVGEKDTTSARDAALAAVREELSQIVGLQPVKDYILSLEDNFKIQQLRRERGLKADSPSMHMIFTGNPGTGKTTVARIVSRYLKAIGVLEGGQLVEVTRGDLVGQYVGHTAPLTQKAIDSALGGVLFIDEAYSLYRGKDDSFGLEAIDTLVKGMEDHRDDLVVILAGYSREMEEFLTANSGLRSRFPNIIEFPDYTAGELLEITKSIVRGKGYRLDPACEAPLLAYFERQQQEGDPRTNGNGRMARNKVEEAVIACSRRNVRAPEEERDLELLLPEDFGFETSGAPTGEESV